MCSYPQPSSSRVSIFASLDNKLFFFSKNKRIKNIFAKAIPAVGRGFFRAHATIPARPHVFRKGRPLLAPEMLHRGLFPALRAFVSASYSLALLPLALPLVSPLLSSRLICAFPFVCPSTHIASMMTACD